jgi:outer membrane protein assembly factor BamA
MTVRGAPVGLIGPVLIVFDFGSPIGRQDDDDTRILNFAFGASF